MNILGIDFEDWFHPELIQKYISKDNNQPKVVEGINKIIELLRKKKYKSDILCCWRIIRIQTRIIRSYFR